MSTHRHQARWIFVVLSIIVPAVLFYLGWMKILYGVAVPLALLGYYDLLQKKQTIRRNFPVVGNLGGMTCPR